MKKKIVLISAALVVFASVEAFSFGIGLRGNFGYGFGGGGSLLFSPNDKLHIGASYYMGEDLHSVGLTADYWLFEKDLRSVGKGSLNFYLGFGLYSWISFPKDEDTEGGLGIRVPIGLDLNFDPLDFFVEMAPQLGLSLLPSPSLGGSWFNAAIGFRFWIN
ncbi:MAG: hypothetical protein LBK66_02625 [Spirochaetaceae bacterium]|nr:hypothetical protein [Spirochaetaceae bacterium]